MTGRCTISLKTGDHMRGCSKQVLLAAYAVMSVWCSTARADNAASVECGARIEMPGDLNTRWNKPVDVITPSPKPGGPIINDLSEGEATVTFPVAFHIRRVGIMQGDYKGSFAKVREAEIAVP